MLPLTTTSVFVCCPRWQITLGAALDLEEPDLVRLAVRGWPLEEIRAAFGLVETLAQTDLDCQQTISAHNGEVSAASQAAARRRRSRDLII